MLRIQVAEQPWLLPGDDPRFLDAVDAALKWINWPSFAVPGPDQWETPASLELLLSTANSVWRVSQRFDGLERRIDPTVTQAVQAAAADPTARDHLATAWEAAYGRQPDPDKAYDEAVLAVETLACPLVCPNNPRPTLGTVIRDLNNQAAQWELATGDTTTGDPMTVDPILAMLTMLWHGQSRHAGSSNSRRQTPIEGQAALHLAATLVQWLDTGILRRK
jgi:hypothetical protein